MALSLLTAFSCFFVPFALLLLPQSLLGQFYQPSPFSVASSLSPYGGGLGGRYSLGGAYCCQPSTYPFYGKPSYAYVTPYGGYGLSGYEGPPYGQNTYWQPGVAYPPSYGSYGAYGGAMGGACRDRSMDCAMLASSGQCASSASTRALCPMSCGFGCGQGDIYSGGGTASMLDPYSSAYRGSSQLPPLGLPPLGQQSPLGARPLMNGGFDLAASSLSAAAAIASPFEQMPPFFCRDSHIFGCPNWAQQGFCQTVPEFMLNYCRASCGVCGGAGGGFGLGGPEGFAASTIMGPASSFSMDPFGSGLGGVGGVGFSPLGPQQLDSPMAAAQLLSLGQAPAMSAGMYAPYLPYAPYYPFKSSSVFGAERKEKQQRNGGTKLMFNEDDQQDMQLFAAGLNSGISPPGQLGLSSASSLPNPSQMLPPSSLSTQHSSVSKLVRMDDLLFDGKKQRKN